MCHEYYDNYREHIATVKHSVAVNQDMLYNVIDDVILELDRKCGKIRTEMTLDASLGSAEKNILE